MIVLSAVPFTADGAEYTVDEVNSLIGGILSYKLNEAGCGSVQEWIESSLAEGAGTDSEWYVLSLSQYGYGGFSAYEKNLREYLGSNNVASATSREKYALALCAAGSTDTYITDILGTSIGEQGIMSWIYGLHVLNNGYECSSCTAEEAAEQLLSMQLDDGGWALWGQYGDIDVTAMTLTALAPLYGSSSDVRNAADRGVDFLSQRQEENGGYQSFGTPNPESAAQVLTALSALGIDCCTDTRFIKNGNTVIDGIDCYRLPDGDFCHFENGDHSESASYQALYSFISYVRMKNGESPFYVFDNRRPVETVQAAYESPSAETSPVASAAETIAAETTAGRTAVTSVQSAAVTSSSVTSSVTEKTSATSASAKKSSSSPSAVSGKTTATITVTSAVTVISQADDTPDDPVGGYKPIAIAVIIAAGLLASLVIFALGKRNYKNFVFVGLFAAAGIAVVLLTDIRSKDEYYSGEKMQKDAASGTVTMSIHCDTIAGKAEHIPEDGVILDVTEFDIEDGDTVFDVLMEASQTCGIQVENRGSASGAHGMVYIAGINYIYEYDFGDLSGWVYHVNGISPSRGCGDYVLSDGDVIEWLYTCELGHDLNEVYEE